MTDNSTSIFSLSLIYNSWLNFRSGKKASRSIIYFEYNLEENLWHLWQDLLHGIYRHGAYTHRIVNEKKRRDIHVATVRDRVVHRLIYDYMISVIDPRLDYDVWSCRSGKGLHACVQRAARLSRRYPRAYVWRGDVQKFFDSVDHKILLEVLKRYNLDSGIRELLKIVIASFQTQPGKGIAIGNLTSQILANVYLGELDFFIRQVVRPLAYVRYGDDFVLWIDNQSAVMAARRMVTNFLHDDLGLELNARNEFIGRARQGLKFVGVQIFGSGSVVHRRTLCKMAGDLSSKNIASYYGFLKNLGSARQRKSLIWSIDKATKFCDDAPV
jgi:retron-type reverse transcriptase